MAELFFVPKLHFDSKNVLWRTLFAEVLSFLELTSQKDLEKEAKNLN